LVKIERVIEALPGVTYPLLLDATARCPPEDVGGPWRYEEFLRTVAEERADTVRRAGRPARLMR